MGLGRNSQPWLINLNKKEGQVKLPRLQTADLKHSSEEYRFLEIPPDCNSKLWPRIWDTGSAHTQHELYILLTLRSLRLFS